MKKDNRIRVHARLEPELAARVVELRKQSGLDGATPPEGKFLAALIARGVQHLEAELPSLKRAA